MDEFGTCKCGGKPHARGLMWSSSKFYAKVEEIENIEETLAIALEGENYDLASILRDLIKEKAI